MILIIDLMGWIGTALVLGAYILISLKILEGSSQTYQGMILVGCSLLGLNAIYYGSMPLAVVNGLFVSMSVGI